MNITLDTKMLRKAEKQDLMVKITRYVGKVLDYIIDFEKWSAVEIEREVGVRNTRMTEIRNYDKYKKPIGEKDLTLFITGGVMKVKDLMKKVELNEKETRYLETLLIFEDENVRKKYRKIVNAGLDPNKLLDEIMQKYNL